MTDEQNNVWVATHFGSRGFGHTIATQFLQLAGTSGDREEATLLHQDSDLGKAYLKAMALAGQYAGLGRILVINEALDALGCTRLDEPVHNHHNYAWREQIDGKDAWVVRKGATPAFTFQTGFIGGSMGDIAAIVAGKGGDSWGAQRDALFSTVHGAGRIHSRTWAKGKRRKKNQELQPKHIGNVTRQMMSDATKEFDVVVRGGDVDESPFVYRKLAPVLGAHEDSIDVLHILKPQIVCMAGAGVPADD